MSVKAVVALKAHKGKGVALLAALTMPLEATRGNADCLGAGLFMGAQSPDELVMLEEWTSVEAHRKHLEALDSGGTMDEVKTLLASEPEITHYTKIG